VLTVDDIEEFAALPLAARNEEWTCFLQDEYAKREEYRSELIELEFCIGQEKNKTEKQKLKIELKRIIAIFMKYDRYVTEIPSSLYVN
jgi:hypothetical protein